MSNERDDARKNRLAAALRENLKRRKQQLRGRAGGTGTVAETAPSEENDRADLAKDREKPPR